MSGNRKQPCDTLDISHYVADMLEIAHEMRKLGIPQAYVSKENVFFHNITGQMDLHIM